LDLLANQYYRDASLWWILATANNLGKSGMMVPPGLQIRIPLDVGAIEEAYRLLQEAR